MKEFLSSNNRLDGFSSLHEFAFLNLVLSCYTVIL